MNILIVGPLIAIVVILIADLYVELKQRYKDWRENGYNENM
tara:strand:- start:318 stop:440 length:123 start_codon:yes stop_codon:yes gene_type:complete